MDFYFYLTIGMALLVAAARIVEVRTKRNIIAGKTKAKITLCLLVLAELALLIGSIIEFIKRGHPFSWELLLAGCACALLSFWIRRLAIAELGKFWSLHIEIRDSHELIQSGPFRWVRHPAYLSMILEVASFAIILHAFYMLAAIPLFFLPVLMIRLKTEEVALIEKFGSAYREYQKRTPAIFPYKIQKRNSV